MMIILSTKIIPPIKMTPPIKTKIKTPTKIKILIKIKTPTKTKISMKTKIPTKITINRMVLKIMNGIVYRRITPKLTSKRIITYNPPMKTKFLAPIKTFWSEHKNTLLSRAI